MIKYRIAMGIAYDGSSYHGWQKQNKVPSVQCYIEQALSSIAGHSIHVICSGRTDAGVHALGQVIHFDTCASRKDCMWMFGCNRFLPKDIRILWVKEVGFGFNARFSALERRYRYLLYNSSFSTGVMNHYMELHSQTLNLTSMIESSKLFLGRHDFFSFQGYDSNFKNTIRTIRKISIQKRKNILVFDMCANSFLLHMVRNIVGALVAVGEGKITPLYIKRILKKPEKNKKYITLSSKGLYLTYVIYPKIFSLPVTNLSPFISI